MALLDRTMNDFMNTCILFAGWVLCACLLVFAAIFTTPSRFVKPPPVVSGLVQRVTETHLKEEAQYIADTGAKEAVMANAKRAVEQWESVSRDVLHVSVSRTQDTNTYVITLVSSGGKSASLWLREDGTIRSISPY